MPRIEGSRSPTRDDSARIYDPAGLGSPRSVLAISYTAEAGFGVTSRRITGSARAYSPAAGGNRGGGGGLSSPPSASSPPRWAPGRLSLAREHGLRSVSIPRVGVGGDSAGGNLSAVVSQEARRGRVARPDLPGAHIYPATDFALILPLACRARGRAYHPARPHPLVRPAIPAGDADKQDIRASPIRGDLGGQPPALVVTAGFDPLRDESHAYADALERPGRTSCTA